MLILLHATEPTLVIDNVTIALIVLTGILWLLPWIRSFEGAGFKVDLGTSPESIPQAKAALEVTEGREAAAQGLILQIVPVSSAEYLAFEDVALAALGNSLLPGWLVLPRQRIFLADGSFEDVDAIIRGPRGYRDTIVEMKLFLMSKSTQVALRQIADVNTKVSTLIARTGESYQPLLLWVAPEEPIQLAQQIIEVIERETASTGILIGLYEASRARISYAPGPPFFVDPNKADRINMPNS